MKNIKAELVYANVFKTKQSKIKKIGVKFVGTFQDNKLTLNGVVEATEANVILATETLREKEVELTFNEAKIKETVSRSGESFYQVDLEAEVLKKLGFKANNRKENLLEQIKAA